MIDFVSTRAGVDPATRTAAQFLAGVVASFIRYAALEPSKAEGLMEANDKRGLALGGIWYLFHPASAADDHLDQLGGNIETMREALLSQVPLGTSPWFDASDRARIQQRHAWWVAAGRPSPTMNDSIPQGETA